MESKESAVMELHRRWLTVPTVDLDWTPRHNRLLVDEWAVLTTEPDRVDHLEVDAAGRAPDEAIARLADLPKLAA
jgi:hypothetical protein